jgi:prepilin-type processing-associated H-X9-DG protein
LRHPQFRRVPPHRASLSAFQIRSLNPKVGQGISSDHPGGVNAVFADGSIRFLSDTIDPKTLAELLDLDGCSNAAAYSY